MQSCRNPLAVSVLALLVGTGMIVGAEPESKRSDEQLLKAAKVGTEGAALLDFFRAHTTSTDVEKIQALIRQLGDDSFQVRESASARLVELGAAAEPCLRLALKDADAEVARRAADCLNKIGGHSLVPVVAAAARLVAQSKPPGAVEVLLAYVPCADDDAVAEEVRTALTALALPDGKPAPVLVAALADKALLRRAAAAEVLVRAGAAKQLPSVRRMLHDPEPAVRLGVALALAHKKEQEAIPVLIDLLAELPPEKLWRAEDLLYRLAGPSAPVAAIGSERATQRKYRDAWVAWWREHGAATDLAALDEQPRLLGHTLVVLLDRGRIIDLDANNKPAWQIDDLSFPLDAQVLPGERVLVAEHKANRVTERNRRGEVLWEKEVMEPLMAQRLPNGNTFIGTRTQITEVDRAGREVYTYNPPDGVAIMRAEKLRNGDMALVTSDQRYVRVDAAGKELQDFPVDVHTYGGKIEVLPSGGALVPQMNANKVVEYDAHGKAVWEVAIEEPIAAVRLSNGNTLVTSMKQLRAVEFDASGKEIWEYKADSRVTRAIRR